MKETGVVRHLDELGRIVIPKEIRKRLKIENSDLLDIFTEQDKIILKKYHPFHQEMTRLIAVLESIKTVYGCDLVLTDKKYILANTMDPTLNEEEMDSDFLNRISSYLHKETSSLMRLSLTKTYVIPKDVIIYPVKIGEKETGYLFVIDSMIGQQQKNIGALILLLIAKLL